MGRGLSDLQSTILRLAYKNRVQKDRNQAELAKLRRQLKREQLTAMDDIRAYHSPANAARRKEKKELREKIHNLEKDATSSSRALVSCKDMSTLRASLSFGGVIRPR